MSIQIIHYTEGPAVKNLRARMTRLMDKATEHNAPQMLGFILAAHAIFLCTSIWINPSTSLALAFDLVHPALWAGLFGLAGVALMTATVTGAHWAQGASLFLSGIHTVLGLLTIPPIRDGGVTTAFGSYLAFAALCLVCQLLWRARERVQHHA